jgi:hypothetical protein
MSKENTHFIFDGKTVLISPNLRSIVVFLQYIEQEIETVLSFDKRLEEIKKQHFETLKLVQSLAEKLKEHSIDFKATILENPSTFVDKLKFDRPTRVEMIAIFAQLEVLLCFSIAYDEETSDEKMIREKAMNKKVVNSFLDNFCLNIKNSWYSANQERVEKISADDLRKLRNSLTHFFSVGKVLSISTPGHDTLARKIEIDTKFKVRFISPEDMWNLTMGAAEAMIKKWDLDCRKCLQDGSTNFEKKIHMVKDLVDKHAAKIMTRNQV